MNGKAAARRLVLVGSAVVGMIAAFLVSKPAAAAQHVFSVELWPGGGSTLSCGWHWGACYDDDSKVVSGKALDWSGNSTVYFKVRALRNTSFYTLAGSGYANVGTQAWCTHQVGISMYDDWGAWRAGAIYLHTQNSITHGTTFNIGAGYNVYSWTTQQVGSTADETNCTNWSGHHVHQIADTWFLRNYPDHSTCNRPNITTDCWVGAGYSQGDTTWTLLFP